MNQNQSRTLWISVGAALFAMLLIYSYSQEKKAEYDKRFGTAERVLVAAKDIAEMQTVDDTMLQIEERPKEFIQPGAVFNPEDAVGFVAAAPIKKGEQILITKLLAMGPNTGLSLQVAPGKRALTIPIDDVRGVSKLIRPGDRIDLLTAIDAGSGMNRKTEVKTLLQDVVILSTGIQVTNNIPRTAETDASGNIKNIKNLRGDLAFATVTIEASPQEAQDLIAVMASAPGSIYLTLRHPSDRIMQKELRTSSLDSVLGGTRSPASTPGAR